MMASALIDQKSDTLLTNRYLFGICHPSTPLETPNKQHHWLGAHPQQDPKKGLIG
jgi:hypothetical protein